MAIIITRVSSFVKKSITSFIERHAFDSGIGKTDLTIQMIPSKLFKQKNACFVDSMPQDARHQTSQMVVDDRNQGVTAILIVR